MRTLISVQTQPQDCSIALRTFIDLPVGQPLDKLFGGQAHWRPDGIQGQVADKKSTLMAVGGGALVCCGEEMEKIG